MDQIKQALKKAELKYGDYIEVINALWIISEAVEDFKGIIIPLTKDNVQELQEDKEFHWSFDGIDIHIIHQEEN